MHTAKKIAPGCYDYRGWLIEEVGRYDGWNPYTRWNVTAPGGDHAEDTTNTLRDAKALVNMYEGK